MYVGAQAVRSPAWRDALKADTAVDMKRTLEDKVRADLAAATDAAEIARLEGLLGLRYMVADISGNLIPHLSGHLAYRLGEVLYERLSWTIWRFPKPVLLLGNDPVLLVNRDPARCGSFSQVARAAGNKLSVWREIKDAAEDAVDVLRGADFVMLPLDPTRLLVVCGLGQGLPALPGTYEMPLASAKPINLLASVASPHWLALPPGHMEHARKQLVDRYPWLGRTPA
jgi:hypothetical protein